MKGAPSVGMLATVCAWMVVGRLYAQDGTLRFEVASVRAMGVVARPQGNSGRVGGGRAVITGGPGTNDPERISYSNVFMAMLLESAYGISRDRITLPDWAGGDSPADADRFEIQAKVPSGATKAQVAEMLRSLLVDRFKLSAHRVPKEFSGYSLIVAQGGPRLKESAGPPVDSERITGVNRAQLGKDGLPLLTPESNMGGAYVDGAALERFRDYPLSELANQISLILGVPVVDRTGLTANYDFVLRLTLPEFSPPAITATIPHLPGQVLILPRVADPSQVDAVTAVSTAIEKQLGLKIEAAKVPLDTLVIDHIERTPTDN